MKLKIAFFGTPGFAADLLEKIISDKDLPVDVAFVVTQPDQPVGRKKTITPSPVKQTALKHGIKFFDNLQDLKLEIGNWKLDIALIYYYGKIIPAEFLDLPRLGFWNIHFSTLPKLRGATPATFSLIMGDTQTAISLVDTDFKLDHGALISQDVVDIDPNETRLQLEQKLHSKLLDILRREITTVDHLPSRLRQQDHSQATYTLFPTKNHGFIPLSVLKKALQNEPLVPDEIPSLIKDYLRKNEVRNLKLELRNSAKIIFDYFRGLYPWPGIWTMVTIGDRDLRLKITGLSTQNKILKINKVQLEGKNEIDFETFNKINQVF